MFSTTSLASGLALAISHTTPTMTSITLAEFHLFHSSDRDIFSRLVINLKRQATQSLLIMALWLWLEDVNSCKIISKLKSLSDNLLDAIANEASLCINVLKSRASTIRHGGALNFMTRVMGQEITLKTISQSKYTAISGVKAFLADVCAWVFTDILLQVLPTSSRLKPNIPLFIPGFPNTTFGALEIYPLPLTFNLPPSKSQWGWKLKFEAPIDDRTLFLTFSRGFPVSEEEAKRFFIQMCGDCIESFEMELVTELKKQSLYARMTLYSVSYMDKIMNGEYMAKFRAKGKHIWARKFERRDRKYISYVCNM